MNEACEDLLIEAIASGKLEHVELALQRLSSSGDVNKASSCDVFPLLLAVRCRIYSYLASSKGNIPLFKICLHPQTWRNHTAIIERLLSAGARPDAQDGESGCGCMARAHDMTCRHVGPGNGQGACADAHPLYSCPTMVRSAQWCEFRDVGTKPHSRGSAYRYRC